MRRPGAINDNAKREPGKAHSDRCSPRDDYQDIVAFDLLVEWMEHPSRYQSIRVEASESGALDDVVAVRSDGTALAGQVKFSAHPDEDP